MGHVVSRTAAADDIRKDASSTHEQGIAQGGKAAEIVDHRLTPTLGVLDSLEAESKPLDEQLVTLRANRDASEARADALVSECFDVVWNRVGRPRVDARLDLLFPGGASAYIGGPVETMPDRMGVLIDLLGRGLHPKLASDVSTEWINKLTVGRTELTAANAAIAAPLMRRTVLDRTYYALAKTLQAGIMATKRDLKSEGFTESQIHEIIPDRPRPPTKATADKKPAQPVAAPTATNGVAVPKPAPTTA